MDLTTADVMATLQAMKNADEEAIQEAAVKRTAADEDMFVAMSLHQIMGKLQQYHQERLQLLVQTSTLHKLDDINTFEAWLVKSERKLIFSSTQLSLCWMLLQIPQVCSDASRVIEERWKDILPSVVRRLNEHPSTGGLPKIKLRTPKKGERFEFWIEFAPSK